MVSSENIKNSECSRQLECISINELLKRNYNFFVPDYQRGYRWGIRHINSLLNDIYINYKKYHKFLETIKN